MSLVVWLCWPLSSLPGKFQNNPNKANMNNKQIAMVTAAALLLAWISTRRRKAQMMSASELPAALNIKEISNQERPKKIQMPQSISVQPDNIVQNLRQPIPAANVPVEPLAQDFRTADSVVKSKVYIRTGGVKPSKTILLSDI